MRGEAGLRPVGLVGGGLGRGGLTVQAGLGDLLAGVQLADLGGGIGVVRGGHQLGCAGGGVTAQCERGTGVLGVGQRSCAVALGAESREGLPGRCGGERTCGDGSDDNPATKRRRRRREPVRAPDTVDRIVRCGLEFRGRGLAAGGAVSSQDGAFHNSGSQIADPGGGR